MDNNPIEKEITKACSTDIAGTLNTILFFFLFFLELVYYDIKLRTSLNWYDELNVVGWLKFMWRQLS